MFRGDRIEKPISVLSGGERARLCLAGLLLGNDKFLILDEPGNHLDVDTVEALAEVLISHAGTVIFTSHDRHFMQRVASCVIEVRDGRVVNYNGAYHSYLYAVNRGIDEGERAAAAARGKSGSWPAEGPPPAQANSAPRRNEREIRNEISTIEKTIARLDTQKKRLSEQLLSASNPQEALRLHTELETLQQPLAEAEERWCQLQEELGCRGSGLIWLGCTGDEHKLVSGNPHRTLSGSAGADGSNHVLGTRQFPPRLDHLDRL